MRELMIAGLAMTIAAAAPAAAETRDLSGFDNVNASGGFAVEVAVGETFAISVEGADAARIRTRVEGDTLKIEPVRRPWFGNPRYDAVIRVTAPRLEGVAAARGASVRATLGGACEDFSAAAAMGGDLAVTGLACRTVDAAAAMGARVRLEGACDRLDVAAAMGATVQARELRCQIVDANAAMGADIAAFASDNYEAAAAMGGDIAISGGGRARDSSRVMGGSISEGGK